MRFIRSYLQLIVYRNYKMGLFDFVENFFFISLGITFGLILLLVYHFKQRISSVERKGDTMFELLTNVVKELQCVKGVNSYYESFFKRDSENTMYSSLPLTPMSCPISKSTPEVMVEQHEKKVIDLSIDDSFPIDSTIHVLKKSDKIVVSDSDGDSGSDGDSVSDSDSESEVGSCLDESDSESDSEEAVRVAPISISTLQLESIEENIASFVEDLPTSLPTVASLENVEMHAEETPESLVVNSEEVEIDIDHLPTSLPSVASPENFEYQVLEEPHVVSEVFDSQTAEKLEHEKAQKREVYFKMNITQLKALATAVGIKDDTSKMKKKELIRLLEKLDE